MPYIRSSTMGDRWKCPICGEIIKTPYHIYEKEEEATQLTFMLGNALDHILHNHCSETTIINTEEE